MAEPTPIKKILDLGFEYSPGDHVMVKKIGTVGTVIAVSAGLQVSCEYRVSYWIHDQNRVDWLFAFDLEAIKGK